MDAVKFIKERNRMCTYYKGCRDCGDCPAKNSECELIQDMAYDDNIVSIVEKWSAEHPRKTRQSVFLEQWPNAGVDGFGVIGIYPCALDTSFRNDCNHNCKNCRRKFWMSEGDEHA